MKRKRYRYEFTIKEMLGTYYSVDRIVWYEIWLTSTKDRLWYDTFLDFCRYGMMQISKGKVSWVKGVYTGKVHFEDQDGKEKSRKER